MRGDEGGEEAPAEGGMPLEDLADELRVQPAVLLGVEARQRPFEEGEYRGCQLAALARIGRRIASRGAIGDCRARLTLVTFERICQTWK